MRKYRTVKYVSEGQHSLSDFWRPCRVCTGTRAMDMSAVELCIWFIFKNKSNKTNILIPLLPVETVENNRAILTQVKLKYLLIYYLGAWAMRGERAIRRTRSSIVKFRARPLTLMKKTDQKVWVTYIHQTVLHQTLEFEMIQWECPQGHWCKYRITTMPFCGVPPITHWFGWKISFRIGQSKSTKTWKRPGFYCFFSFCSLPDDISGLR